jgi:hypothetical protein
VTRDERVSILAQLGCLEEHPDSAAAPSSTTPMRAAETAQGVANAIEDWVKGPSATGITAPPIGSLRRRGGCADARLRPKLTAARAPRSQPVRALGCPPGAGRGPKAGERTSGYACVAMGLFG